jgi:hypothetical protein
MEILKTKVSCRLIWVEFFFFLLILEADVTPKQIIEGDFVMRVEDVEFAIWKIRSKVNPSYGDRGGRGGRGNLRGRGRGGRSQG